MATTPESSDDESAIAKASEFAQHQSGKNDVGAVGTNEFYGFALYLGTTVGLCKSPLGLWRDVLTSSVVHWMGLFTVEVVTFHRCLLLP